MTADEVNALKEGDKLRPVAKPYGYRTAAVMQLTDNYVAIKFPDQKRNDVISRTSPLWSMLELVP